MGRGWPSGGVACCFAVWVCQCEPVRQTTRYVSSSVSVLRANACTWSTGLLKGSPARSEALSVTPLRLSREMLSEWLRTILRAWCLLLVCEQGCLPAGHHTLAGKVVQNRCAWGRKRCWQERSERLAPRTQFWLLPW